MTSESKRPDFVTEEHLDYLDDLRESGSCNMFAAGDYLAMHFGMPKREARPILTYWMKSFGKEDR